MENRPPTTSERSQRITGVDVVVAAIAFGLSASTAAFNATKDGEPSFTALGLGVLAAGSLPLVWRRRFPAPSLIVAGVGAALYGIVDWSDPLLPFGLFVALSAVFEYSRPSVKWAAWAATAASALIGTGLVADSDALDWWVAGCIVIAAPLMGDYLRARRRLVDETRARLDLLEAERLHELAGARTAERTRVAGELHDVVAHHITMLVVQAEAAASRADLSGAAARASFDDLARSGRSAMNELRSLLGVLRSGDRPSPIEPQPTLDDLEDLVAGVRAAGATVSVAIGGPVQALPIGVELAAYRVIQEGLTNAVKHAPGAPIEVSVNPAADDLAIRITNAAAVGRVSPLSSGPGSGLIGLHERVALLGGTLVAEHRPLGGYRLEAHFPVSAP